MTTVVVWAGQGTTSALWSQISKSYWSSLKLISPSSNAAIGKQIFFYFASDLPCALKDLFLIIFVLIPHSRSAIRIART